MKLDGKLLIQQLEARDLVAQISGDAELETHLQQSRSVYCGFDPTAANGKINKLSIKSPISVSIFIFFLIRL